MPIATDSPPDITPQRIPRKEFADTQTNAAATATSDLVRPTSNAFAMSLIRGKPSDPLPTNEWTAEVYSNFS